MAKQELSLLMDHLPSCQHALFIPEQSGWVPPCQTHPTLSWGMVHNVVHVCKSSLKIHITVFHAISFLKLLFKNLVLLCLMLPCFQRGLIF